MSRVIASIVFDLSMVIGPDFPPPCQVAFTDVGPDGHESAGRVLLLGADAASVWASADPIAAINAVLDAKASALPDLPSIAARMTAVDALDVQHRAKVAALAALDEQIAAKTALVAAAVDVAPANVAP